jgi:hypothetical protein
VDGFSFNELTDMLLMYGRANCNGRRAARLYQERFPDRRHPNHKTLAAVDRQLRETGTFKPVSVGWGRQRAVRTSDMEERVLDHVDRDAGVSTRQVGEELNVSHMAIWRVLHEQLLYPYHECRVSCLLIFQRERTFVGALFNKVLSISLFNQCSLQMRHVSVETAS